MVAEAGGIHSSKAPVWADMGRQDTTAKEPTEREKLQKTNVWDYAATALQAGAYGN